MQRSSLRWVTGSLCAMILLAGCGEDESSPDAGGGSTATATPQANVIAGRVTMADGSALRGEIKEVLLSIYGVSEAAEKVHYGPIVKPDGTFKQKVSGGQYTFGRGQIKVMYNGTEFPFDLEPQGPNWNKSQDAADGIVQNFVWKTTGPTPYGQSSGLDIGNATHWYGMNVGLRADGYRNDIGKTPTAIPDGSKLIFTLKPTGKAVDGTDARELTFEREHSTSSYKSIDLNDLLPAPYEMTGVAKLPDGTIKPLLLQGKGDYPGYKPSVRLTLEKDGILGGLWKQPISFVVD